MYQVLWRYKVKPEYIAAFLKIYDSSGEWAQLFVKSPNFIKTELFYETNAIQFFITVDHWKSKNAYQEFYKKYKKEIDRLDALGNQMTIREERIGEFITEKID